jgi:glycosyltransferase involved in cell wall biosynthesis
MLKRKKADGETLPAEARPLQAAEVVKLHRGKTDEKPGAPVFSGQALPLQGRRVLIIVENLPVPFDRRVWQEARTLKAAGAQVVVICPTGKGFEERYEVLEGIHVYRHPLPLDAASALGYLREYASALYWETKLAWKAFFKHGFDVIHACNPPDLIFLVALPFKLLGKRFLFDHHDINPELYEAKFNRRDVFWRILLAMERLTFRLADVTIATNESYKAIAVARGGMDPNRVFVVRSGPDLSRFQRVAPNASLKKGRKHLVGYVGVMGEQEGIDLLLDAVSHIVHRLGRKDIQFCLVGGGPSLAELKESATSLGISDFVTFLGRAPDATLFEVLSTADVCVNPDRVNPMNDKSTMNKIIEYMAMGKPIVQFDVTEGRYSAGPASEYARANDPIDFAEKLLALLADGEKRQEMGRLGRTRVENELSWEHQIPKLIGAYQAVLR